MPGGNATLPDAVKIPQPLPRSNGIGFVGVKDDKSAYGLWVDRGRLDRKTHLIRIAAALCGCNVGLVRTVGDALHADRTDVWLDSLPESEIEEARLLMAGFGVMDPETLQDLDERVPPPEVKATKAAKR